MELKIARRGSGCSVFDRLGTPNNSDTNRNRNSVGSVVCIFWRNGRCRKNPCRFLHSVSENETEAKSPVNYGSGGVQIQIEGVRNGSEHNPCPRKKLANNTWALSKYPIVKNVVEVVASESEQLYCPRKRPHCVVTDKTLVLSKYPVVEDEVEVVASESEHLFPLRKRPHCEVTENTLVLSKSPVPDHEDCPHPRKKPQVPDHNKSEDELQNVVAAKSEEENDVPNNSLPTVANNPSSEDEDVTPSKSLGTFVEPNNSLPNIANNPSSEDEDVTPCKSLGTFVEPNNSLPTVANNPSSEDEDVTPSKSLRTFVEANNSLPTVANNNSNNSSSEEEDITPSRSLEIFVEPNNLLPTVANNNSTSKDEIVTPSKPLETVCQFWVHGNCAQGDQCQYLHSWFRADGLGILANLQGHNKAVTGIALPENSNKLYSGSRDGTFRVWDCDTGLCVRVNDLGTEVGSLICRGIWVFVGMTNVVKAWNTESGVEYNLDGPVGQVYALETTDDVLFAGGQDGVIKAWKGSYDNPAFHLVASLKGHTGAVLSLVVGCNNKRLYSSSKDHTIRVWDNETFQCIETLSGHTDIVTALICCNNYLLSSSLDRTIKVWALGKEGNLEVVYTRAEEHGVLALSGMTLADNKHILFCSYNDNSVQLYELPSFTDRGRLFAKQEVKAIQIGPSGLGLFFTGDETGLVTVWKWLEELQNRK
ncbi:uncharacterized protein LOC126695238 isoform X1 [Quercus robur]|uniref:uncharacterized protein LOC126695238 isoform X1 n=1 Tax=Quercus robur TaxID=38942 RepID=UPI002161C50C|nr:uncharacterized protein LOC126695238 isoform X1 [Quercus robur]XP_050247868.1 uncharacterized protein LOC126695238 isoform X1 [Quercus robur]